MTAYYARAFKAGAYPTILRDRVYVWARPHPRDANSPDHVPRPTNYQLVRMATSGALQTEEIDTTGQ
jgi:glucan endo-1,3-alpha-glucosidase